MPTTTFAATVPSTGERVDLTFSAAVTGVSALDFPVIANGVVMRLGTATGSGTAWSLPLDTKSGWVPVGQTVKVSYLGTTVAVNSTVTATNNSIRTQAQQRYVERELGIFVHLSSSTWGTWGAVSPAYIAAIDMPNYDPEQWFTSVIVPSGARYAVLTSKHDGGFALWPTAAGNYNIAQTAFGVAHPGADVIRDWVRLCRKYNIAVGLYIDFYDTWWTTSRPGADGTYNSPDYVTYMNQQITELFSNYGKIDILWIDALAYWVGIGYGIYPWSNVVALRDSLQPECKLVNNAHEGNLSNSDIAEFEGNTGASGGGPSLPASSNTVPSEFCEDSRSAVPSDVIYPNDPWIWSALNENNFKNVYQIAAKVLQAKAARTAYLLNFPVNTSGLMPTVNSTYATQLGGLIGKQGANPVEPGLFNVRAGIDRGDGQIGIWGGGINSSAILGVP
jgi:alpha-L-fucosidase